MTARKRGLCSANWARAGGAVTSAAAAPVRARRRVSGGKVMAGFLSAPRWAGNDGGVATVEVGDIDLVGGAVGSHGVGDGAGFDTAQHGIGRTAIDDNIAGLLFG